MGKMHNILEKVLIGSMRSALRMQGLDGLKEKLTSLVPDISNQYSGFKLDTPYLCAKVRGMHAFQISLIDKVIAEFGSPVIVDIGDSSGTHLSYIRALYPNKNLKALSVNLDEKAVNRIREKGFDAVCSRAEDLERYNTKADIFLCFQTMEHLMDPCKFLHDLSEKTNAKYLIMTVPYLKKSRIGLHHIRDSRDEAVNAENTHLFELCPGDWKLLSRHAGWSVVKEEIYLQYPKYGLLRLTQPWWARFDFEGFYGLILTKDKTWSSRYSSWEETAKCQR